MTAIILLAAGGSSRMNQQKQLLQFRGKSLLRHSAEIAVAAQVGPVLVVLGCEADQLQKEIHDLPIQCIINPEWDKGIGTSIRAGVRAVAAARQEPSPPASSHCLAESKAGEVSAVLFMLCDQPLVDANILRTLVKTFEKTRKPIVASQYGDAVGVPALFDRSYFPQLLTLGDAEGAKHLIYKSIANAAIIPVHTAAIDVDTPEDYQRLSRQ